jgi:1,4-dihydroxy-2-naphthoate octaprenyltransferase
LSFTAFFKLVEIQTKIASITPFLLGNLYLFFHYDTFYLSRFIFMLISLLAVDMGTTAVNNYQDYIRAKKKEGYNYEIHNAIVNYNLSEKSVKMTIAILFLSAVSSGILLYLNTDIVVILIGALSFLVGILYTSGPVPISRTPSGEFFSGFFMGFFIPFLSIYIHNLDLINLNFISNRLNISLIYTDIINIFIFTLPMIMGIANIMLANNICDIEDDIENNRYTLAVYIGRKKSLELFKILYYISYLSIIISVILGILPYYALIALISFFAVKKNISLFYLKQSKKDTFVLSVKNFALINYSLAASLIIALIL